MWFHNTNTSQLPTHKARNEFYKLKIDQEGTGSRQEVNDIEMEQLLWSVSGRQTWEVWIPPRPTPVNNSFSAYSNPEMNTICTQSDPSLMQAAVSTTTTRSFKQFPYKIIEI